MAIIGMLARLANLDGRTDFTSISPIILVIPDCRAELQYTCDLATLGGNEVGMIFLHRVLHHLALFRNSVHIMSNPP